MLNLSRYFLLILYLCVYYFLYGRNLYLVFLNVCIDLGLDEVKWSVALEDDLVELFDVELLSEGLFRLLAKLSQEDLANLVPDGLGPTI